MKKETCLASPASCCKDKTGVGDSENFKMRNDIWMVYCQISASSLGHFMPFPPSAMIDRCVAPPEGIIPSGPQPQTIFNIQFFQPNPEFKMKWHL